MFLSSTLALGRRLLKPVSLLVERAPMMKTLDTVNALSPGINRLVTRLWYQHMTRLDKRAEMTFMNYGYAPFAHDPASPTLAERDEGDRYCIQLYHHVAAAVDLKGRDVLEIGCGRGGGASYVCRYLKPGTLTGVDLAHKAVAFCREHHTDARLSFRQGEAESLPFDAGSFDAVINIESSHSYASMAQFLSEVHRCLRPGGWFLLADRRNRNGIRTLRRQLALSGLEPVRETCITDNILRALDLDEARRQTLIRRRVPWFLRSLFRQFAATKGTSLYNAFSSGGWEYYSFVLRKTETRS